MEKRTFNTEADVRNYKSKMLLYPKKLLFQINQMILDGKKEWAIENFLKQNYKGTLGIATPPTIGVYIDWFEAKQKISAAAGKVIEPTMTDLALVERTELVDIDKEHRAILDGGTDISNKKELLERLIKKCIQRMKHVETLQEMEGTTASLEAVVGHYLREIHGLVQTQLKLSGELAEESNAKMMELVNKNLYKLVQLIFTSINTVAPEKSDALKQDIFKKLQEHKDLAEMFEQTP